MKVLLTAINAKYIHTSLAIRYLKEYSSDYKDLYLREFTINHSPDYILNELFQEKPDVLCLSCYIWNIEMIKEIIVEFKKVSPDTLIILGGPEVSYEPEVVLTETEQVDIIIQGEGEITFNKLLNYLKGNQNLEGLKDIKGLCYRLEDKILNTGYAPSMDMDTIPFPYKDFAEFENKIIYYETTRGCPFNCQYCLSSIEKGVRYRSFNLVKGELQQFLDQRVMQVKFVDRTFNCSREHAENIWSYLIEHDNGYTNFHFEISADVLRESSIELLKDARPGLFQFEIGVQSTNLQTIDYIKRKMDLKDLEEKVRKITALGNIHQHLDLIAGLPGEDYQSFGRSFNDVYAMEPEQLQLGFLKVLKGAGLFYDQDKYGLVYREKAPYEILYTKHISFKDMLKLKMIEEMVELYYNSGRFTNGVAYIITYFESPFACFEALASFWEEGGYHHLNHSKLAYYDLLMTFFNNKVQGESEPLIWLLLFDLMQYEKAKKVTEWMKDYQDETYKLAIRKFYHNEENIKRFLPAYSEMNGKQISRKAHVERFGIDIMSWLEDKTICKEPSFILFDYSFKNPVINQAKIHDITDIILTNFGEEE